MKICNCPQDLDAMLCDIPNEWREGIVKALCLTFQNNAITCVGIRDCQTLTSLSAFTIKGTEVSISYINEKGTVKLSTFDLEEAVNSPLDIEENCIITSPSVEDAPLIEQLQVLISAFCECCPSTTTTTSTSTTTTTTSGTTTTSTTTTTTEAVLVNLSVTNSNHNSDAIAQVIIGSSISLITGSFPITLGETGTASITPGTYTVIVKVGSGSTGKITVVDTNSTIQCQQLIGSASYSFNNVAFATTAVTITLSLGSC